MSLADIVAVSNRYGKDHAYVLAGGGNTSYKDDDYLYIKSSGVSLAAIDENGFVRMKRRKLQAVWTKQYAPETVEDDTQVDILNARCREDILKRPSVEVLLHDLFPQKLVLHVHPTMVNGVTCGMDGEAVIQKLFGNKAAWMPSINPGYTLAESAKAIIDAHRVANGSDLDLLFIGNHGVFFAADTAAALDALVADTMSAIGTAVKEQPDVSPISFDRALAAALAPAVRMLVKNGPTAVARFVTNADVQRFTTSAFAFAPLIKPFTPDHIVYCGDEPLFVRKPESDASLDNWFDALESAVSGYIGRKGHPPKVVAVEGLGFFACGKDKKEADIVADMFRDAMGILVYAGSFGGPKPMTDEATAFITSWELEKYRQKVSLGKAAGGGVSGKIAVITGGAQGFGQGIAEHLIAAGMNLVIADLNEQAAAETAAAFNAAYGPRCIAVKTDVSDEASVQALVTETVLAFGGLDVYISNAGINKSGGLAEMDVATFERITKVNYTAYFLGAKYASDIMKTQNRFAPDWTMDIIQINSKSGLAGSNKNFAYAGGKFGGIGLTQSFALELIPYNIKVNAVCPGNYFESPLWSDPERGLFVQYLNSGKVPGAKTVADVKHFYESKTPMQRGCSVRDVARAVVYVMEQTYETGQAVPVTGGQHMLK